MNDKPRRWTWEEWKHSQRGAPRLDFFAHESFHANKPLLGWQEKEIARLCSRVNYLVDHKNDIKEENEELEQRIAELEADLFDYKRLHGEWLGKTPSKQDRLSSYKKVCEFLNEKGAPSRIWSELEKLLEPNGIFLKQRKTIAKLREALDKNGIKYDLD